MSTKPITIHAAKSQLSRLIVRACAGEEIVIARAHPERRHPGIPRDAVIRYRDRLVVTFGERPGPGSVVRIENKRIAGERERLLRFFEECGVAWE